MSRNVDDDDDIERADESLAAMWPSAAANQSRNQGRERSQGKPKSAYHSYQAQSPAHGRILGKRMTGERDDGEAFSRSRSRRKDSSMKRSKNRIIDGSYLDANNNNASLHETSTSKVYRSALG